MLGQSGLSPNAAPPDVRPGGVLQSIMANRGGYVRTVIAWMFTWLATLGVAVLGLALIISSDRSRNVDPNGLPPDEVGYVVLALLGGLVAVLVATILAPTAVYGSLRLDGDELARSTALWSTAVLLVLGLPVLSATLRAFLWSDTCCSESSLFLSAVVLVGPLLIMPPAAGRFVARWRQK